MEPSDTFMDKDCPGIAPAKSADQEKPTIPHGLSHPASDTVLHNPASSDSERLSAHSSHPRFSSTNTGPEKQSQKINSSTTQSHLPPTPLGESTRLNREYISNPHFPPATEHTRLSAPNSSVPGLSTIVPDQDKQPKPPSQSPSGPNQTEYSRTMEASTLLGVHVSSSMPLPNGGLGFDPGALPNASCKTAPVSGDRCTSVVPTSGQRTNEIVHDSGSQVPVPKGDEIKLPPIQENRKATDDDATAQAPDSKKAHYAENRKRKVTEEDSTSQIPQPKKTKSTPTSGLDDGGPGWGSIANHTAGPSNLSITTSSTMAPVSAVIASPSSAPALPSNFNMLSGALASPFSFNSPTSPLFSTPDMGAPRMSIDPSAISLSENVNGLAISKLKRVNRSGTPQIASAINNDPVEKSIDTCASLRFPDGMFYFNPHAPRVVIGRDQKIARAEKRLAKMRADWLRKKELGLPAGPEPQMHNVPSHSRSKSLVSTQGGLMGASDDEGSDAGDAKIHRNDEDGNKDANDVEMANGSHEGGASQDPGVPDVADQDDVLRLGEEQAQAVSISRIKTSAWSSRFSCPIVRIHAAENGIGSTYSISREHLLIDYNPDDDKWHVRGLGKNGFFLDDEFCVPTESNTRILKSGTVLQIGSVECLFSLIGVKPGYSCLAAQREAEVKALELSLDFESGTRGRVSDHDLSGGDDDAAGASVEHASHNGGPASANAIASTPDAPGIVRSIEVPNNNNNNNNMFGAGDPSRTINDESLVRGLQALARFTNPGGNVAANPSSVPAAAGDVTDSQATLPESSPVARRLDNRDSPYADRHMTDAEKDALGVLRLDNLPCELTAHDLTPELWRYLPNAENKKGPGRPPKPGRTFSNRVEKALKRAADEKMGRLANNGQVLTRPGSNSHAPSIGTSRPISGPVGGGNMSGDGLANGGSHDDVSKKTPRIKRKEGDNPDRPRKGAGTSRRKTPPPDLGDKSQYTPEQLKRPDKPYQWIIYDVLCGQSSEEEPVPLPSIYKRIKVMYPFFFFMKDTRGWESSVRHNLSANACFQKVGNESSWWHVPGMEPGPNKSSKHRDVGQNPEQEGENFEEQEVSRPAESLPGAQAEILPTLQQGIPPNPSAASPASHPAAPVPTSHPPGTSNPGIAQQVSTHQPRQSLPEQAPLQPQQPQQQQQQQPGVVPAAVTLPANAAFTQPAAGQQLTAQQPHAGGATGSPANVPAVQAQQAPGPSPSQAPSHTPAPRATSNPAGGSASTAPSRAQSADNQEGGPVIYPGYIESIKSGYKGLLPSLRERSTRSDLILNAGVLSMLKLIDRCPFQVEWERSAFNTSSLVTTAFCKRWRERNGLSPDAVLVDPRAAAECRRVFAMCYDTVARQGPNHGLLAVSALARAIGLREETLLPELNSGPIERVLAGYFSSALRKFGTLPTSPAG